MLSTDFYNRVIRLPFESRGEKTNDRFLGHDEMKQKLKVIEERDRRLRRERFWNLIEICRLKTRVKTLVEKGLKVDLSFGETNTTL